jgi:hypothetical protein
MKLKTHSLKPKKTLVLLSSSTTMSSDERKRKSSEQLSRLKKRKASLSSSYVLDDVEVEGDVSEDELELEDDVLDDGFIVSNDDNAEVPSDTETSDDDHEISDNEEFSDEDDDDIETRTIKLDLELDDMVKKCTPPPNETNLKSWCMNLLGINQDIITLQLSQLPDLYEKKSIEVMQLYKKFLDASLISITSDTSGNAEQIERSKKFGKLNEILRHAMYCVSDELIIRCLSQGINYGPTPSQFSLFRYAPEYYDNSNVSAHQKFLIYALRHAQDMGLRRYETSVYKQKLTSDGKMSHAWEPTCSIKDFVYNCVDKDVLMSQWQNLTKDKGCAKFCIQYLEESRNDREFPYLKPDRHAFSFENGIYFADYTDNSGNKTGGRFFRYEDLPVKDSDIVTCKFFEMDFPEENYARWQDIPTPKFNSIFKHQSLDVDVIEWLYALLGRLFYELGEKECWQILLFFKGIAGSGKSTIGKFIRFLFNPSDVGILSCGNHEKKFGLEAIFDKLIYMCLEVKEDFGLPQDVLQSMITGEPVSVSRKNKVAQVTDFKIPGIFFGNEFGKWVDNAGSVSRRFLVCEFLKSVRNGDSNPRLLQDIQEQETALLIQKMNRAYLEFAEKYGKKDIWDVVPIYFRETKSRMRCRVNSLMAYIIESKEVEVVEDGRFTPISFFHGLYRKYCKSNNLNTLKIDAKENCDSVFEELGIELIYDEEERIYAGRPYTGSFIKNLVVKDSVIQSFMNYPKPT